MKKYGFFSLMIGFISIAMILLTGCQSSQSRGSDAAPETAVEPGPAVKTADAEDEPAMVENVPVITIPDPVHDFGEMGPGGRESCEFKFSNTGAGTLKIDRIQSTCGCTVPELQKKEYAPGESGVVKVAFHAPSTKSETTKHLYIISNDPQKPRAEITIKAEVVVKVDVSPERVDLRLDKDNAGMENITVKSLDDRVFSIQSITVSPQAVMKIPFDASKKAQSFTLEPVVDTEKLNQTNTGVIQIKTDHPQSGTLVVRYQATPKYELSRPRIILQNVEPGVPVVKDVIIRSNYGEDVQIESVSSKNGYMEVESQEKDGEHLQLQVKITPPEQGETSRRYITDSLDITLTDGTALTIRCSGWFKLT